MCHHDNLPSRLRRRKYRDEFIEYRLRVQILLGLVDNQWSVIVVVKREVQQQKNYAARAWRQFFDIDAVVSNAVPYNDVIGIEEPLRKTTKPGSEGFVLFARHGSVNEEIFLILRNEITHCFRYFGSRSSLPAGFQFSLRSLHQRAAPPEKALQSTVE